MKVLLIAGHGPLPNGGFDPGATGYIAKGEHRYMVQDLFPAMKKFLPKNADAVFHTAYDVFSRKNLASLAKQHNADAVIEFHYDATGSSQASGGHVIVYSGYEPDGLDLRLRDAIKKNVGVRYSHRGHQGVSGRSNLQNVNIAANNNINYRLLELGFGTNKKDAEYMLENVEQYAKDLVNAIFKETKKAEPVKIKPKTKPVQPKTSTVSGAKLVKNEKARFTVTASNGIKVRNAPSTNAKHTGSLKKGASIVYNAVFEGNGYRWLRYTGNSGNTLYVPYRPLNDVNNQWGLFSGVDEKPVAKPKPQTVSGAKLVKHENATFTVTANAGIKVRNAPSTKAKHTGTLRKGTSIRYDRVYEGNGYRWLSYIGGSGNRLYVPYRPINDKNNQWGRFG